MQALRVLIAGFQSDQQFALDEPFIPVSAEFERIDPKSDAGAWCLAQVLVEHDRLSAESSFDRRADSLRDLSLVEQLGFATAEVQRRLRLVRGDGTVAS